MQNHSEGRHKHFIEWYSKILDDNRQVLFEQAPKIEEE